MIFPMYFSLQSFFSADDLKLLSLGKTFWNIQDNLHAVEKWVKRNKMDLAMEKCLQMTFQGVSNQMKLPDGKLDSKVAIKDLGVREQKDLSWRIHVDTRICQANQVLYIVRRNVHYLLFVNQLNEIKKGERFSLRSCNTENHATHLNE